MRFPLLSLRRHCPRCVSSQLPPSPASDTATVVAGTRARCNDGACLRTAHCASCESQSPRIRSSMLAPMPLYAFLQAATSYQDSRRSSYDTRRLGGPLVFFPPAPPGALLRSLSCEAAASSIASAAASVANTSPVCAARHYRGRPPRQRASRRHCLSGACTRGHRRTPAQQHVQQHQQHSTPSRRRACPPAPATNLLASCSPP